MMILILKKYLKSRGLNVFHRGDEMGAGVVDITSSNYDIDIQSLGCQNCEILKTFNTILNFEEVCEI